MVWMRSRIAGLSTESRWARTCRDGPSAGISPSDREGLDGDSDAAAHQVRPGVDAKISIGAGLQAVQNFRPLVARFPLARISHTQRRVSLRALWRVHAAGEDSGYGRCRTADIVLSSENRGTTCRNRLTHRGKANSWIVGNLMRFLAEPRNAVLASVNAQNAPVQVPVFFDWHDGNAYVSVTNQRGILSQLRTEPQRRAMYRRSKAHRCGRR